MRQKKFIKFWSFAALLTFSVSGTVFADDAQLMTMMRSMQQEMEAMRGTIAQQNDQIRALQNQRGAVEMPAASPAAPSGKIDQGEFTSALEKAIGKDYKWLKDLKFKGDLRLRYEGRTQNAVTQDDRNRFRFRLRFGFEKKLNEEWKVGFRLASVDGAESERTSTNASFDNAFRYKTIEIDKAYATYTPNWADAYGLEITAGKFSNPFEDGSSKIVWDSDLTPEGIYERVNIGLLADESYSINMPLTFGQFVIQEGNGGEDVDSELYAFQGGFTTEWTNLGDKPVETSHLASYYHYKDFAQNTNFVSANGAPTLGGGSVLAAENYYIFEIYNEVGFQISGLPKTALFFDWLTNLGNEAATKASGDEGSMAWAVGAKLGKVKKKKDWALGYEYRYVAENSVPGVFNDSDFGGGNVNNKGHVLSLGYGVTDFLELSATALLADRIRSKGADPELDIYQVDLAYKF